MPLSAFVNIENALDEDYEDEYALPQPGRLVSAGVVWKY